MLKIGDYVTRNSYNNDIVFKIININNNICYLRGVFVRLCADSNINDLKKYNINNSIDDFNPVLDENRNLDRNEFFYLPGRILHLDGDKSFLDRCMNFYRNNEIKAYGFFVEESDFSSKLPFYLSKYSPDILVLTGHDALYRKKRGDNNYKNTSSFVMAVKEARRYEKSHDKLLIVAGACQSNYEELIKAGANFASSPKRINIHALDPAIIAGSLSFSDKNKPIDLINILKRTKYGSDGIGGIITNGTMYVGYPKR